MVDEGRHGWFFPGFFLFPLFLFGVFFLIGGIFRGRGTLGRSRATGPVPGTTRDGAGSRSGRASGTSTNTANRTGLAGQAGPPPAPAA